jgi:hypothetical protein
MDSQVARLLLAALVEEQNRERRAELNVLVDLGKGKELLLLCVSTSRKRAEGGSARTRERG